MSNRTWGLITVAILCIMLFGNRKVRLWCVVKAQLCIFRNAKKQRLSPWDFISFLLLPIISSWITVYKLNISISINLAETLTTVFSIVFTVLFGFASVLISKIESPNKIERRVVGETFVSIVSSTILSLIAAILSIVRTQIEIQALVKILSVLIMSISMFSVMLLLMITKRTFYLYIDSTGNGSE